MITPVFTLKQNDEFLLIEIKAPYAKIQETEIEYFDKMFYFSSVPYYLRLHLPCNVVQDDESCVTYDHDEEKFIIKARKLRHGEFFPNLDMIGELLNPSSMIKVNNLVEECGDNDDEFCMVQECGNSSQEVIDGVCHSYGYGFGWRRHNVFEKLDREISNIIDLRDPDNTSIDERTELCLQQDINQFNPDRYAVDLHEPDDVLKLSLNYRLPETCFELSEKNRQHLQDLARKKAPSLTEACTESLMLSLIDILFAYLYELRTTEGEYNVESGWTIAKLSPTLAYLLRWKDADEAVLGCVRRALCYPIFRHWQLCLKVFRDLKTVLSKGKIAVLHSLVEIRFIFSTSGDFRYLLNDLFMDDYCRWIQSVPDQRLLNLLSKLETIKLKKSCFPIDLSEVEMNAQMQLMKLNEEMDSDDE